MIPLAALTLARRWWPAIAIVALLLAGWGWGRVQYRAGVQHERAEWLQAKQRWDIATAKIMGAVEAAVDRSAIRERAAISERNRAEARSVTERSRYYAERPAEAAAVCVPAERVRAANDAIRSFQAATPAAGSAGAVPGAAAAGAPPAAPRG